MDTDSIIIHGSTETAEIIEEDGVPNQCGCCGYILRVNNGLLISGEFKMTSGDHCDCPICGHTVELQNAG